MHFISSILAAAILLGIPAAIVYSTTGEPTGRYIGFLTENVNCPFENLHRRKKAPD